MEPFQAVLETMTSRIITALDGSDATILLTGSAVLNDFRPGWSDVDLLTLTAAPFTALQAQRLVGLRQQLTEMYSEPLFRAFEGAVLPLNAFLGREPARVVYWGTSGERVTDRYDFSPIDRLLLLDSGVVLHGNDMRSQIPRPSATDLRAAIQRHYDAIRRHARQTGRSLYSFGWLLDISRCLYTLRTGQVAAKTAAGEWALQEDLCPCPEALALAVTLRKDPARFARDPHLQQAAAQLGESVQQYADVLEKALAL